MSLDILKVNNTDNRLYPDMDRNLGVYFGLGLITRGIDKNPNDTIDASTLSEMRKNMNRILRKRDDESMKLATLFLEQLLDSDYTSFDEALIYEMYHSSFKRLPEVQRENYKKQLAHKWSKICNIQDFKTLRYNLDLIFETPKLTNDFFREVLVDDMREYIQSPTFGTDNCGRRPNNHKLLMPYSNDIYSLIADPKLTDKQLRLERTSTLQKFYTEVGAYTDTCIDAMVKHHTVDNNDYPLLLNELSDIRIQSSDKVYQATEKVQKIDLVNMSKRTVFEYIFQTGGKGLFSFDKSIEVLDVFLEMAKNQNPHLRIVLIELLTRLKYSDITIDTDDLCRFLFTAQMNPTTEASTLETLETLLFGSSKNRGEITDINRHSIEANLIEYADQITNKSNTALLSSAPETLVYLLSRKRSLGISSLCSVCQQTTITKPAEYDTNIRSMLAIEPKAKKFFTSSIFNEIREQMQILELARLRQTRSVFGSTSKVTEEESDYIGEKGYVTTMRQTNQQNANTANDRLKKLFNDPIIQTIADFQKHKPKLLPQLLETISIVWKEGYMPDGEYDFLGAIENNHLDLASFLLYQENKESREVNVQIANFKNSIVAKVLSSGYPISDGEIQKCLNESGMSCSNNTIEAIRDQVAEWVGVEFGIIAGSSNVAETTTHQSLINGQKLKRQNRNLTLDSQSLIDFTLPQDNSTNTYNLKLLDPKFHYVALQSVNTCNASSDNTTPNKFGYFQIGLYENTRFIGNIRFQIIDHNNTNIMVISSINTTQTFENTNRDSFSQLWSNIHSNLAMFAKENGCALGFVTESETISNRSAFLAVIKAEFSECKSTKIPPLTLATGSIGGYTVHQVWISKLDPKLQSHSI